MVDKRLEENRVVSAVRRFVSPPVFESDEIRTQRARLVNGTLGVVLVGVGLLLVTAAVGGFEESLSLVTMLSVLVVVAVAGLKLLLQRGFVRLTGTLLVATVWFAFTFAIYSHDGIRDSAVSGYFLVILVTSLMLGLRALSVFNILNSLGVLAAYLAEQAGLLVTTLGVKSSPADLSIVLVVLNGAALLSGVAVRQIREGMDRAQRSALVMREERDRAQRYLDIAGTIIVALNVDQEVTLINRAGCAVLGYPDSEILGRKWFDSFVPERVHKATEEGFAALVGNNPQVAEHFENPILTRDGVERLVAWYNVVLRDEQGQVMGTLSSGHDITEQRNAEESMRESEERYRTLFEGVPVGLYRTTPDGHIIDINPTLQEMLGFSDREQVQSRHVGSVYVNPQDRAEWQAVMDRDGFIENFEVQWRRHDGKTIWVRDSGKSIRDDTGRVLFYEGAVEDVTARRHAESQREAALEALEEYSERLEETIAERTRELQEAQEQLIRRERLAVLGQLAGGLGHELRTPLGVISNLAYYVQMAAPDLDESLRESLELIVEETHNAAKIVSDLLDFARIKASDQQIVAASTLVKRALAQASVPDDIEVHRDLPDDLSELFCDPRQIVLVLGNLITNACQAMPDGGSLTLAAQPDGEWVTISVSDTGHGICEENMDKLFEPLFTTRPRGIGLGLTTSRSLVEANGGRIQVQSALGEGSTFAVRLPTVVGKSGPDERPL